MTKAVIQYLRGLDLTGVHFGPDESVQTAIDGNATTRGTSRNATSATLWPTTDVLASMCRLQWLKLRDSGLTGDQLPAELAKLSQLENLSISRNTLTRLSALEDWSTLLPSLRSLNCRKNNLTDIDAIPVSIFECPNLQVSCSTVLYECVFSRFVMIFAYFRHNFRTQIVQCKICVQHDFE